MFIVCRHYGNLIWKNWRAHTQNEWLYILFLFKLICYLKECLIHHLGLWDWKGRKGKEKKPINWDVQSLFFFATPSVKGEAKYYGVSSGWTSKASWVQGGCLVIYSCGGNVLITNLVLNSHDFCSCCVELGKTACKKCLKYNSNLVFRCPVPERREINKSHTTQMTQ